DPDPLCALALQVNASTLVPTAMDVVSPDDEGGPVRLALRFESGIEAAITDQCTALAVLAASLGRGETLKADEEAAFWRGVATRVPQCDASDGSLLLKASVLPTAVSGWLTALQRTADAAGLGVRFRAHAGHGIVYVRLQPGDRAGDADALA